MNTIQDIWRYANLAYDEPVDSNSSILLKDSTFTRMKNDTDFFFIADFPRDPERVIISFRGTPGKPKPWISNLDFKAVRDIDGGTVHEGFYLGWNSFEQTINDYVQTVHPTVPIFCTGHSRGAALSTLCAFHLVKKFPFHKISNINFGCPKVGKADFRDSYNYLPIYTSRVVNGYDLVPSLPLWDMGFRDLCPSIDLYEPFWHNWIFKIHDHITYDKAVKRYKLMRRHG
jgi:Lipase (class 3)